MVDSYTSIKFSAIPVYGFQTDDRRWRMPVLQQSLCCPVTQNRSIDILRIHSLIPTSVSAFCNSSRHCHFMWPINFDTSCTEVHEEAEVEKCLIPDELETF